MILKAISSFPGLLGLCLLLHAPGGWVVRADNTADDLHLRVQLIWATNGPKPDDSPKLKDVDETLKKKFRKVFKWRNYYSVREHEVKISKGELEKLKLSEKCELKVHNLGASVAEVTLVGEGERVKTVRKSVCQGELLVLAGEDKDDTAWFVILFAVEPEAK